MEKNLLLTQERLIRRSSWPNLQRHFRHGHCRSRPNSPHFGSAGPPASLSFLSTVPISPSPPHSLLSEPENVVPFLQPHFIVVPDLPFPPVTSTNISCTYHIHQNIKTANRRVFIIYVMSVSYHVKTMCMLQYCSVVTSRST